MTIQNPTQNPENLHSFSYLDEILEAPFGWTKKSGPGDRVFLVAKFGCGSSAVTVYEETSIWSLTRDSEAPAGIGFVSVEKYSFRFFAETVDGRPAFVAEDGDQASARLYFGSPYNEGVIDSMRDLVTRAALLEELVRKLNSGIVSVSELASIVAKVSPENVEKILARRKDPQFVTLHA